MFQHYLVLNDLESIKSIIENIVERHSKEITSHTIANITTEKYEFNIQKTSEKVTYSSVFDELERDIIEKHIQELQTSLSDIMESKWFVTDQEVKKLVPLSYELLYLLFSSTNEHFRQCHFHELINFYFGELCKKLEKSSDSIRPEKVEFDLQVKILLPIIKLEVARRLMCSKDVKSDALLLEEILFDLKSFFKCPRFNKEDIFSIVENNLRSTNYHLVCYEIIPLDARNGHLGEYFKLQIMINFEGAEKKLNLFAKFLTPKMEVMRKILKEGPSKKEEFFYLTYLNLLKKYGLESLTDFAPKCYFSRQNDVLVLEDMITAGFTALTPNIKLNIDSLILIVKQIAKLHSCSMVLEQLLTKEYNRKVTLKDFYEEYMEETLFKKSDNHDLVESFESTKRTIFYITTKFPDLTKNIKKETLEKNIEECWNELLKKISTSDRFKNVLCHGDMYVANMLFKFNSKGVCENTVLIDFQILRYCPPTHDLLFFIYQNSLKETRDRHFRRLVDTYYSEVEIILKKYNFQIEEVYPREDFEQSLNYMKTAAIYQALFYSITQSVEPKLREDLFSVPEITKKYFSNDKQALVDLGMEDPNYREVFRGLTADFMDICKNGEI